MKRGFLKTEKASGARSRSFNNLNLTTSVVPLQNAPFNFSPFSRVISRDPYIVEADDRLRGSDSVQFLFFPSNIPTSVFVDTLKNIHTFEKWINQAQRTPPPNSAAPAFAIRGCAGKGLGVFAQRAIRRGELIMAERPVYVSRPGISTIANSGEAFYESALAGLSPDAQRSVLALRNAQPPDNGVGAILGRLHTNALVAKPPFDPSARYLALFPNLCRLNHDCTPNSHYSFSSETFTGRILAVRAIEEGEELTLGYVDLVAPRDARRVGLREKYHFECTCPTCELPEEKLLVSDAKRRVIAAYFARLGGGTKIPADASLEEVKQLIKHAEDDGLVEALSILVVSALRLAKKAKNHHEEIKYVVDGVNWMRILEGNDAPGFCVMAKRLGMEPEELVEVFDCGEPIDYARFKELLERGRKE
uniref:SET domain-containing protein n=1 Tax=Mycena chlorophos TaxID=658473 RepID=A0ABQ0M085_MYCCL|nr:predicted protein [Mycena chlorophos]